MSAAVALRHLPARDIFFLNFGVHYSRARWFIGKDLKDFPIHLLRNSDITVANVLRMLIAFFRHERQLTWVSLRAASATHASYAPCCCTCLLAF